jgi:arsenate reductase (thioredoxin)
MKCLNFLLITLLTSVLCASCTNSQKQEIKQVSGTNNNQQPTVLFVCEHGSAKSVVAAAHFNKLAREQNLNVRAISRGTNPDEVIPPKILQGLQAEGLTANEPKPQMLSKDDVTGASRVVTFCELPEGYNKLASVEQWNDVPPISEDYNKSRDAMLVHINQLLDEVKSKK